MSTEMNFEGVLSTSTGSSQIGPNTMITHRTLTDDSIRHSVITSLILTNFDIYDCTIASSTLVNCRKCLISALALHVPTPTLSKLPVEIRNMIFEHCLHNCWNGKLSELLVALKGSDNLYVQALEVFRKVNAGVLFEGARGELENMKENPLSGIKTLVIERKKLLDPELITFGNYTDFGAVRVKLFRGGVQTQGKELKFLSWICPILQNCKSVTSLTITLVSPSEIIFDDREESGFYILENIMIDSITHFMRRFFHPHMDNYLQHKKMARAWSGEMNKWLHQIAVSKIVVDLELKVNEPFGVRNRWGRNTNARKAVSGLRGHKLYIKKLKFPE